jgi:hypothetical protein
MALRLPDKWVWDFWLVRDGMDYHAFYLQAPRSLGDPELRHLNASVGHAVSKDLRHWRVLPDALSAGPAGAWDDRAVWTGCVFREKGRWHMFYTGVSVEGDAVGGSDPLAQTPKEPAHRGRPAILRAAGRGRLRVGTDVARPVGLQAPPDGRLPRAHHRPHHRGPIRRPRRDSSCPIERPGPLGDLTSADGTRPLLRPGGATARGVGGGATT